MCATRLFRHWSASAAAMLVIALLGGSACGAESPKQADSQSSPLSSPSPESSPLSSPSPESSPLPSPSPESSPNSHTADELNAAKVSCSDYVSGVAPVINEAVVENNLALLIRIENGQPPQGGPVSADAPYFLMVDASVVATNWDSQYQSLADAVTALGRAIDDSTPGDAASLEKVALAGAEIEAICAGIS